MENTRLYERTSILTLLPPVAATAARTSTYVELSAWQRGEVAVTVGTSGATGTITLIKAADTSGSSSAAIATVAFGSTATENDNKVSRVSIDPADMCDEARPYFAFTIGGGPAETTGALIGVDPRYAPPTASAKEVFAR